MMQGIESSVVIMQQKNLSLSDKNCVLLISFLCYVSVIWWRKLIICRKSLTLYHIMLYRVHIDMSGIRTQNFNEWVSDCCLTIIQQFLTAISWREQVNFQWDDDAHFVLDQHAELDFYIACSLKQQFTGRHIAPLRHIILIPSRPVFALSPNAAGLAEKQQIPIL